jgi:chromosome segregation ATPase
MATVRSDGGQAVNPQYEAHERMCKAIGDMANENTRLQERIKLLEESLESANTFLQLVMCEQNHLRDLRNKANDRIKQLEDELNELRSNESRLLNSNGELERRIDQLEETGDELLYDNDDMTNINRWHEAKEAKP